MPCLAVPSPRAVGMWLRQCQLSAGGPSGDAGRWVPLPCNGVVVSRVLGSAVLQYALLRELRVQPKVRTGFTSPIFLFWGAAWSCALASLPRCPPADVVLLSGPELGAGARMLSLPGTISLRPPANLSTAPGCFFCSAASLAL